MSRVPLSPSLGLHLDRLIHLLVTASSGGGKTWALLLLLERALKAGVQQVIIDWEGEFANLRERGDYVIVGKDGDVPIGLDGAELLARRCMELRFNLILDLSEMPVRDRHEFVRRFLNTVNHLPRDLWHDALIVIDEGHKLCPQKEGRGESSVAKGEVLDLLAMGRKRGFRAIVATQRLAKLDKDAAAECSTVMVGKHNLPEDRQRAVEVLALPRKLHDEWERHVMGLRPGSFLVLGEAFGAATVNIAEVRALDEPVTRPPPKGEHAARPPPPKGAVLKVLEQIRDLPKEVVEEAATLEKYVGMLSEERRRAEMLQHELDGARADLTEARAQAREVKVPVLTDEDRSLLRTIKSNAETLVEHQDQFTRAVERLQARATDIEEAVDLAGVLSETPRLHVSLAEASATRPARDLIDVLNRVERPVATSREDVERGESSSGGVQQRILDALAELEALGIREPPRQQAALLAGYKNTRSKGFSNALSAARTAGLLDYAGDGGVKLTEKGRARAKRVARPLADREVHERICALLGGVHAKILKQVVTAFPASVTRPSLAAACGYDNVRSKGFTNPLSRLHALGLVENQRDGTERAAPILFPNRRR